MDCGECTCDNRCYTSTEELQLEPAIATLVDELLNCDEHT